LRILSLHVLMGSFAYFMTLPDLASTLRGIDEQVSRSWEPNLSPMSYLSQAKIKSANAKLT
jgi:hypothetical protein